MIDDMLFDEDEQVLLTGDDYSENEIIGGCLQRLPQKEKIEYYTSRGYINEGDIIITPPVSKDVHIDRHVCRCVAPGFVDVMNTIAGNDNWGCHSESYTFDLTKTALVYERLSYAEDEMNESKECGLDPKKGPWIASKRKANIDDQGDEYDYMAALFLASDGQEYNVFAYCSIGEPQSGDTSQKGLKFLGVFALDRKNSFILRRRIFHRVSDRIWIA